MDRNLTRNGLVNLVALVVAAGAAGVLAGVTHAHTLLPSAAFLLTGVAAALLSYFQMRLEEAERLEKLEYDELSKAPAGSALFTGDPSEVLPARRSREQFEKWFVPVLTVLILSAQGWGVWWLWKKLESAPLHAVIPQGRLAMAVLGMVALILFLLGKYTSGLARIEGRRLLRPAASHVLLGAYLAFGCTVAIGATELGFAKVDLYVARILAVLLGITAVELILNLLLEIYRPRVKGRSARILYESRFIGLLAQPEGLVTTAAQALDYQFGFKVSETWFYRFIERAFAWLILLQLGLLFLSTTFVIIEPREQALLERFGKPVAGREVLEAGIHFKWPWPIDRIHRHVTREVQRFVVGVVPDPELENERTLLWTKAHNKEEINMIVATGQSPALDGAEREQGVPVNLLTVSIPVQFRVTNLVHWATRHAAPRTILERLASREVVRYLVNVDFEDIMGRGRLDAAAVLQQRVQLASSQAGLGVEIVFLGLQDIHPPIKVAKEFEAVIGAQQEAQTNILSAQEYAASIVPSARAKATNHLTRAQSERANKNASVMGEAALFTHQHAAYRVAPSSYAQRAYLETVARSVAGARKYIIAATNTHDVVQFNFEDKLRPDLLDVAVPPARR